MTGAADGYFKIFDLRTSTAGDPVHSVRASQGEVLSVDWNKYDTSSVATAGNDKVVRLWDLRGGTGREVMALQGHGLAVRKVQ